MDKKNGARKTAKKDRRHTEALTVKVKRGQKLQKEG